MINLGFGDFFGSLTLERNVQLKQYFGIKVHRDAKMVSLQNIPAQWHANQTEF